MFYLPDLPYDYSALEPIIDKETMVLHHDKHHAAYVTNLNNVLVKYKKLENLTIEDLLSNLEQIPKEIKTQVINFGGGHYNHNLFWTLMAPGGEGKPKGKLEKAINNDFGSFPEFQELFNKSAMALFGSGWTFLVSNKNKLEIVSTPNQESPISNGLIPILALDVWEHAYYLKYQNRRAEYISNWWKVVNWPESEKRFLAQD